MGLSNYFQNFISISPFLIAKVLILFLNLLYIFFAGVVFRQVDLMNQVLEARFSSALRLLAIFHLVLIILLFFLALIFL